MALDSSPSLNMTKAALSNAMRLACAEARRWLGITSPNPPVGAVALDESGEVLAIAAHQGAGTAHAEVALIEHCRANGLLNRIHTLCVTLEPCNHQGLTPPCCEAIIAAGIQRIAIGTRDPNLSVKGGGIKRLQEAGLKVTTGIEEDICRQLIYAFAYSVRTDRPWVTIKQAFDEQGSRIPPPGQKTFTSQESLRLAHQLRKRADAILTGSGTILVDHPRFTVRYVPDYPGKSRILGILDRRRRVHEPYLRFARANGFTPVIYDNLHTAMADLAHRNMREVLVEAGPLLSQTVLKSAWWTMDVTIRKGNPDKVEVKFNPKVRLPFDKEKWCWENVLPGV